MEWKDVPLAEEFLGEDFIKYPLLKSEADWFWALLHRAEKLSLYPQIASGAWWMVTLTSSTGVFMDDPIYGEHTDLTTAFMNAVRHYLTGTREKV